MTVRVVEMPLDYGASQRGVNLGPTALRLAGLTEELLRIGHQPVDDPVPPPPLGRSYTEEFNPKTKYLPAIVEACKHLADRVEDALEAGHFPLVLGGDHSLAVGSIAGASRYWKKCGKRLGVLWIDAHGDYNTPETTPSGNVHGMPLAASNGLGHPYLTSLGGDFVKVRPEATFLFGVRDLDPGERSNLKNSGARVFTMSSVDRDGIHGSVERLFADIKEVCDVLHVSFDVDSLDPGFAPGVGTPVPGGLSFREAHYLMECLAESGLMCSLDVVEVNPILDARNATARLAVDLVGSVFGSKIF